MIDDTPKHPFEILRPMDYSKYVENKSHGSFNADYLSWAVCWSRLKSVDPNAHYIKHPVEFYPDGSAEVHITLLYTDQHGDESVHHEYLAVRDFKMQAENNPNSVQIENTFRRCVAKAVSMATGFGLELWYNEDIRDLDYRKETLINGQATAKGKITVDQNVKLDRLSRDPVFKDDGSNMSTQVRDFIASMPTEEAAEEKISKLQDIIKKEKANV